MKSERLDEIRRLLLSHGFASVADIVGATGASLATIRRDLDMLEEQGVVARVHGGAKLANATTIEAGFENREGTNLAEKRAIAQVALRLISPHSTSFFDSGTTVLQLARALRVAPLKSTAYTNGLTVAQALIGAKDVSVWMLGGRIRGENLSLVGPSAEAMLDTLWFDSLFLGTGAIAPDGQIYGIDETEARLNTRMIARAARVYLLADASKFGRTATYAIAPLSSQIEVITDSGLSSEWRERLADDGVKLTIAELPPDCTERSTKAKSQFASRSHSSRLLTGPAG